MRYSLVFFAFVIALAGCAQPAQNTVATNTTPAPTANLAAAPASSPTPVPMALESEYTDLRMERCKRREPEENSGAIVMAECPGIGGYKIVTSASDHSQSVEVIDPAGKETLLDVRSAINSVEDFMLGDKVEWRSSGKGSAAKPAAIIFRLNLLRSKDPGVSDEKKTESYLVVAKVAGGEPCVTDMVGPEVKDQNEKARELSNTASARGCLPKVTY